MCVCVCKCVLHVCMTGCCLSYLGGGDDGLAVNVGLVDHHLLGQEHLCVSEKQVE